MGIRSSFCFFLPVLFSFSFKTHLSIAMDSISAGQSLSGNQTISSKDGNFELGFFTPGNSHNYYIGIWYKRVPVQTVVWVANRDKPLPDPYSCVLKLSENGNLVLIDRSHIEVWSTGSTSNARNSTIAELLENGNLVLRDGSDSSAIIWQSFDYPTDTWLPGGKLGTNKLTNKSKILTSWKNSEDPASGTFSFRIDGSGCSLNWNGSLTFWTSKNWTGVSYSFIPELVLDYNIYNFSFVSNENESYFTYSVYNTSVLSRFVMGLSGQLKQSSWLESIQEWHLFWSQPRQVCEPYNLCGAYAGCDQYREPHCRCLQGFEPKFLKDWNLGDWSGGCVRKTPLPCGNGGKDTFVMMPNVQLPVNSQSLIVEDVEECKLSCLSNCSCTAYAYDHGCLIWQGDLLNLQQLSLNVGDGREFHLRLAASDLISSKGTNKKMITWFIVGALAGIATLLGIAVVVIWRRTSSQSIGASEAVEYSLMMFTYRALQISTKNFSEKLGGGGFGSVFRGALPNLTAIAVKKLEHLRQGEKQFRAEVTTIGTIQHINLVRLRGFCAEGTKRFLVYDYMPNGSLDSHLFRKDSNILDWKTRYQIALGIAKGLAYLHDKCRDCIIHCDIKPENILLDAEFSPKIADFGLAKLLGRDFSRVLTTIRGTRGYLAPEWISGVAITPKADVYSFGMVLFEVISGRRNLDLSEDGMVDYFPTWAVNKGEEVICLLDYKLQGKADIEELTRASRVACWCIQDDEKDRPSMRHVVQILEGVIEVGVPPVPRFLQSLAENKSIAPSTGLKS